VGESLNTSIINYRIPESANNRSRDKKPDG
jgi:hypothetical protein